MEFEGIDLPLRQNEVTEIQGWMRSGEVVALTCYARDSDNLSLGRRIRNQAAVDVESTRRKSVMNGLR